MLGKNSEFFSFLVLNLEGKILDYNSSKILKSIKRPSSCLQNESK